MSFLYYDSQLACYLGVFCYGTFYILQFSASIEIFKSNSIIDFTGAIKSIKIVLLSRLKYF